MSSFLRTPLYDWHVAHHGRMVEFGGWEMPIQYSSIVEEHHAVRQRVGLFDISHMGRLRFRGPGAVDFLDQMLTNDVRQLAAGQVRYSLVCNASGGILDDVLVYRMDSDYWLVVNAANRLKIVEWFQQHDAGYELEWEDLTEKTGMIAVQGPRSATILSPSERQLLEGLKYYEVVALDGSGDRYLSRTGYTGEDGCELIVPAEELNSWWSRLIGTADEHSTMACGLGARDTLRLEAAMPLYGHELSEQLDPLTAGLAFAVKLQKARFVGKSALEQIAAATDRRVRVGLELVGRRIAREGSVIWHGEREAGVVTSGTFSPTLERSISMGYVDTAAAGVGTALEVDIRGRREAATVVKLPFYRRKVQV